MALLCCGDSYDETFTICSQMMFPQTRHLPSLIQDRLLSIHLGFQWCKLHLSYQCLGRIDGLMHKGISARLGECWMSHGCLQGWNPMIGGNMYFLKVCVFFFCCDVCVCVCVKNYAILSVDKPTHSEWSPGFHWKVIILTGWSKNQSTGRVVICRWAKPEVSQFCDRSFWNSQHWCWCRDPMVL